MIKRYQALVRIIIILIIVMILFKICMLFLWPFLIAVVFSFLLEPLVKFICKFGVPRKLGVLISIAIAVISAAILVLYLSQYTYNQTLSFFQHLSSIMIVLEKKFNFTSNQRENYTHLIKTLEGVLISSRTKIFDTIITTINGLLYTIVIFMSTIFISIDLEVFRKMVKKNVSMNIYKLLNNISIKIGKIIRVEIRLILTTTALTIIGLYILGVNNALTIGIICGILDLLPILGPAMIFIPLIIYEFVISNVFVGTGLILLYILLQVSREIMKIKLVGQSLKIHPILTLLSLYLGVILYGLWGVVLGPIIVILIIELFNEFYGGSRLTKL
jgi:predicted PurR-regulated permease PerM